MASKKAPKKSRKAATTAAAAAATPDSASTESSAARACPITLGEWQCPDNLAQCWMGTSGPLYRLARSHMEDAPHLIVQGVAGSCRRTQAQCYVSDICGITKSVLAMCTRSVQHPVSITSHGQNTQVRTGDTIVYEESPCHALISFDAWSSSGTTAGSRVDLANHHYIDGGTRMIGSSPTTSQQDATSSSTSSSSSLSARSSESQARAHGQLAYVRPVGPPLPGDSEDPTQQGPGSALLKARASGIWACKVNEHRHVVTHYMDGVQGPQRWHRRMRQMAYGTLVDKERDPEGDVPDRYPDNTASTVYPKATLETHTLVEGKRGSLIFGASVDRQMHSLMSLLAYFTWRQRIRMLYHFAPAEHAHAKIAWTSYFALDYGYGFEHPALLVRRFTDPDNDGNSDRRSSMLANLGSKPPPRFCVVIRNADLINTTTMMALRTALDDVSDALHVVFINGGAVGKFPEAIRSRCVLLRAPVPTWQQTSAAVAQLYSSMQFYTLGIYKLKRRATDYNLVRPHLVRKLEQHKGMIVLLGTRLRAEAVATACTWVLEAITKEQDELLVQRPSVEQVFRLIQEKAIIYSYNPALDSSSGNIHLRDMIKQDSQMTRCDELDNYCTELIQNADRIDHPDKSPFPTAFRNARTALRARGMLWRNNDMMCMTNVTPEDDTGGGKISTPSHSNSTRNLMASALCRKCLLRAVEHLPLEVRRLSVDITANIDAKIDLSADPGSLLLEWAADLMIIIHQVYKTSPDLLRPTTPTRTTAIKIQPPRSTRLSRP